MYYIIISTVLTNIFLSRISALVHTGNIYSLLKKNPVFFYRRESVPLLISGTRARNDPALVSNIHFFNYHNLIISFLVQWREITEFLSRKTVVLGQKQLNKTFKTINVLIHSSNYSETVPT